MAANGSELDYELYEDALIYSLYGKIFIRNLTTKKASSNVIKVMLFVGNVIEGEKFYLKPHNLIILIYSDQCVSAISAFRPK